MFVPRRCRQQSAESLLKKVNGSFSYGKGCCITQLQNFFRRGSNQATLRAHELSQRNAQHVEELGEVLLHRSNEHNILVILDLLYSAYIYILSDGFIQR